MLKYSLSHQQSRWQCLGSSLDVIKMLCEASLCHFSSAAQLHVISDFRQFARDDRCALWDATAENPHTCQPKN
jgi:hypothetical protein